MENLLLLFDQPDHPILQQVGWTRLAKELSNCAYFSDNQQILLKAPHYLSKPQIEQEHKKLSLFDDAVLSDDWKVYELNQKKINYQIDLRDLKNRIKKQVLFTLTEINDYVLFWEQATTIPKILGEYKVNQKNDFYKLLVKEFRQFVDYMGHADFKLHPVIGPLYKKLQDFEKKTAELIHHVCRQLHEDGKLQYESFDIINGCYTLPIRTDRYSNAMGKIVHRSDSGATLHVELQQLQEHSKIRNSIQEQLEHEIFTLEKKYSEALIQCQDELDEIIHNIQEIDYYSAKAKWASNFSSCLPEITSNFNFEFQEIYHPLIEEPVKNALTLNPEKKVMLISGPNTGGKSIMLKAVAINYLLLNSGLPLAAKNATLCNYPSIYYLASDGQDLDQGLSSFAAEVQKLLMILDSVDKESILLVDEIFNSTSSEEASSIAYSVMEFWIKAERGPAIFTSHHQSLKTWVHENNKMESAHMGFDLTTATPTYVLHQGVPGSSFATQIFEKFLVKYPNLSELLKVAKLKQEQSFDYEKILKQLQDRENEIRELTNKEKEIYSKLKAELNAQKLDLQTKKRDELEKLKSEIEKIRKKGQALVINAGKNAHSALSVFENEFWTINKEIEKLQEQEVPKDVKVDQQVRNKPEKIIEGQKYYSAQWRRTVEVLSVSTDVKTAEVMMGKIKTRIKVDELFETEVKKTPSFISSIERTSVANAVLDARGMRLEDFQKEIDKGLSFVSSGDLPYFEVIHGHGDGILKKWLRDYLSEIKTLYDFEIPDRSLDGVTKVYLK